MAERVSSPDRGPLETAALAGVGALALAARRLDELAGELATGVGVDPDDMRSALADAVDSWRREARRVGDTTSDAASRFTEELGIATRDTVRELELRVAQLEHRLKLLESRDEELRRLRT
jgi:polyhydroxyalkanoate synthesis regulator phasin